MAALRQYTRSNAPVPAERVRHLGTGKEGTVIARDAHYTRVHWDEPLKAGVSHSWTLTEKLELI